MYHALLVLFSSGLRRGELLGLQWGDVDFESQTLRVRRARVLDHDTTPKSGKARDVAIPAELAEALFDLLARRRQECLARGWREVPPWVFCSETGGPLDARNFERFWFRVRRRAQKEGVRPFKLHATRHTYASLALASGKSVKWVADQLGLASPALTLQVYAHAMREEESGLSFASFGGTSNF